MKALEANIAPLCRVYVTDKSCVSAQLNIGAGMYKRRKGYS